MYHATPRSWRYDLSDSIWVICQIESSSPSKVSQTLSRSCLQLWSVCELQSEYLRPRAVCNPSKSAPHSVRLEPPALRVFIRHRVVIGGECGGIDRMFRYGLARPCGYLTSFFSKSPCGLLDLAVK